MRRDSTDWLTLVAVTLAVMALAVGVQRLAELRGVAEYYPIDDGQRPAYFGRCGGIGYLWHYDPRSVPSGASCQVDRIER